MALSEYSVSNAAPVTCQKSPAAGAEQEARVAAAAVVVHGIDGHVIVEQAGHKTDGCNTSVQQSVQKAIQFGLQAFFDGFHVGAGYEQGAQKQSGEQEGAALFLRQVFSRWQIGENSRKLCFFASRLGYPGHGATYIVVPENKRTYIAMKIFCV